MADNVRLGKEEEEAWRCKFDDKDNDDNDGYRGGGGRGGGGRGGGGRGGGEKGKKFV